MTYADIMLFDVLDRMYPEVDVDSDPMSKLEPTGEVLAADGKRKMAFEGEEYPRVKAMMAAVAENEGVKKYLESREGGDNLQGEAGVQGLGYVDFDSGCSTILLGQCQYVAAVSAKGTPQI